MGRAGIQNSHLYPPQFIKAPSNLPHDGEDFKGWEEKEYICNQYFGNN